MLATSIAGRAEARPMLADLAIESLVPGDTPILSTVFPDKQVPATKFSAVKAPVGNRLLVVADDAIGRSTKMIEESMEVSKYDGSLGWHGRQRTIPYLDIDRAEEEKAMTQAMGQEADPLFDLEASNIADMQRKNQLHAEMLAGLALLDEDNYLASHRFSTILETAPGAGDGALDVVNNPNVREILFDASNLIFDNGVNAPPTVTVIGVGARRGLQKNPAFLDLLPEDAIKRLTENDLLQILEMPDGSKIVFPNLRVQLAPGATPTPLLDNFIGVYRVAPPNDKTGQTYGRNYWKADRRNNKRVYVNSIKSGIAEDLILGLTNWYKIAVINPALGAHIPTISPEIEEEE